MGSDPVFRDAGKLKEIVADQQAECVRLLNAYKSSEARVASIALLEDRLFAPKNKKLAALNTLLEDAGQQSLFDLLNEHPEPIELESEKEETITIPAHSRKKSGRKPLPANLPHEEVVHDIPEEEKVCACGYQLTRIGEETSEQLFIERPKLRSNSSA